MRGAFLGGLLTQVGRPQPLSPGVCRINNILWLRCLKSVPGMGRRWWEHAACGCRRGAAFPGLGSQWPLGVPFTLAWDTGLRQEAAGPVPGLPVQVGTAGLSSSLLGQGQTQDKVVPSLFSGWLPPCLRCPPAPALPSSKCQLAQVSSQLPHTPSLGGSLDVGGYIPLVPRVTGDGVRVGGLLSIMLLPRSSGPVSFLFPAQVPSDCPLLTN